MVYAKFDQFLREVLKLPTAVFEGPSFGYTEHSVRTCFPQQVGRWHRTSRFIPSPLSCRLVASNPCVCVCFQKKIMLNTFLDVLMADPPPQCLVWLPLMHRLANVENGEFFLEQTTPLTTASTRRSIQMWPEVKWTKCAALVGLFVCFFFSCKGGNLFTRSAADDWLHYWLIVHD